MASRNGMGEMSDKMKVGEDASQPDPPLSRCATPPTDVSEIRSNYGNRAFTSGVNLACFFPQSLRQGHTHSIRWEAGREELSVWNGFFRVLGWGLLLKPQECCLSLARWLRAGTQRSWHSLGPPASLSAVSGNKCLQHWAEMALSSHFI